jgi:hypothetical protein
MIAPALAGLLLLNGCATNYSLVAPGAHEVHGMNVTPRSSWNSVPSFAAPGGVATWTADGLPLNSLAFFAGIEDGKPLLKASAREEYPAFRAEMLPNEVMELVESTVAKQYGATISGAASLDPLSVAGSPGFEFEFEFIGGDKVERRAYGAGAIHDSALWLLLYQAPRLHYYDLYLPEVKGMAGTLTLGK